MTAWIWSRADHKGLARFVNESAAWEAAALDLGIDRLAAETRPGGRRKIVELIYEKLRDRRPSITYDREEFLLYRNDCQKIRTPQTILHTDRRGTCLDLSLLFCALCLKNDLLPFILVLEGHACAAVLLTHGRKNEGDDAWDAFTRTGFSRVRDSEGEIGAHATILEWITQDILLPVECTGFAYSQALPDHCIEGRRRINGSLDFESAVAAGREQIGATARPFRYAIDIHYLQVIGFEVYAPNDSLPVVAQQARGKHTIQPEYLTWLTTRMLEYGVFQESEARDRLADDIDAYLSAKVRLRSTEPRSDLNLMLTTLFQHVNGQDRFAAILANNVHDGTRRLHLIHYARDLAALAALPSIFSHVELSRRDLRRCYFATLRDPQRAREVNSVYEALRDLVDLPLTSRDGWQPISEFVERVARLCKADALHRWVEEHESDPVRRAELYVALDHEDMLGVEYIVVDVPSAEPEALEFWRGFDRNGRPQIHDFLRCSATTAPLRDLLTLLAENAADWSTNVHIELFLPMAMLSTDIDQWACETFEGTCALGQRHSVAIRWRERGRDGKRRPQWQAFVAGLQERTNMRPALGWLEPTVLAGPILAERVTRGDCGDCLAFSFVPFGADIQKPHGLLRTALGGGMAYGMWLRQSPADWQAFRDELEKVVYSGALEGVPARIKGARCGALDSDNPRHPFFNLTLLWDEPRRNPWSQGQLTEPEQNLLGDQR